MLLTYLLYHPPSSKRLLFVGPHARLPRRHLPQPRRLLREDGQRTHLEGTRPWSGGFLAFFWIYAVCVCAYYICILFLYLLIYLFIYLFIYWFVCFIYLFICDLRPHFKTSLMASPWIPTADMLSFVPLKTTSGTVIRLRPLHKRIIAIFKE